MQRELSDLMDLVATLEQSAGRLMPQVVKAQILDSQQVAGPRERSTDALGVKGEYIFARLGLCAYQRPSLGRVFESPVVPILVGRVLGVPYHASPRRLVVVAPFQTADLGLSPAEAIAKSMMTSMGISARRSRPLKCSRSRASSSAVGRRLRLLGLPISRSSRQADRACCTISGLTGSSRTLLAALRNDADPDQVVDRGCGAGALRTAGLNMPYQVGRGEGVRNVSAKRMPLQEFQMSLFASLPARNRLEGVDVPADQFGKGRGASPQPSELPRIFERNLAMPGPTHGCRAVGKCPAFPMQDLSLAAQADYCRVASGTVGLLAYFDRWHDRNSGET